MFRVSLKSRRSCPPANDDVPSMARSALLPVLEKCLARAAVAAVPLEELERMESLLAARPLADPQHGVALRRLRVVQRYLRAQEMGAARYELRQLAGFLDSLAREEEAVVYAT